jgi:transglutaminase/protease-like cytokinesis protein 3
MKQRVYISLLLGCFVLQPCRGNAKDYGYIDSVMRICPTQNAKSVESIAQYIKSRFDADDDMLRAAYSWVAQHVTYDIGKMYVGIKYQHESEVVKQVLQTRKTVCFGYAVTFKSIAEYLGLQVVIVKGYTKQNDKIDAIPHAWCAVKHNAQWRLIDPTWSSGYLLSGAFHKHFNDKWYLVAPEAIIKSHIPFDPVWQFSYFPINSNEFVAGTNADSVTSRFFSYPDTIKRIEHLSEKERLIAENQRITAMNDKNPMTLKYIKTNKTAIANIVHNEYVNVYNQAVTLYNTASDLFNRHNPQAAKSKLNEASEIINTIHNPNKEMTVSVRNLKNMINKLHAQIEN